MPKISGVPSDAAPVAADYVLGDQSSGPNTKTFSFAVMAAYFWALANIPAGNTSPVTRDNFTTLPYVAAGLVITPDAAGSTKNASFTAGTVFINGRFISIAAVSARTYTASDDTYVDILDNGDGTGTVVYTAVANNSASPALAANSIRIGIVVCGATFIANQASINQGQETIVLPIVSSVPYTVTDSLGNLICSRDPNHITIGYRQVAGGFSTTSTSPTYITGLSVPVIAPGLRKVEIEFWAQNTLTATASTQMNTYLYSAAAIGTLTTQLVSMTTFPGGAGQPLPAYIKYPTTPGAGLIFYTAAAATGNASDQLTIDGPMFIKVKLA